MSVSSTNVSDMETAAYSAGVLRTVLIGGLIAGAGDLAFAFTFYGLKGATPFRILQFIASGAALGMVIAYAVSRAHHIRSSGTTKSL